MQISFIIPVYNIPKDMLLKCLNSVLNIKEITYEVIIIDDGSSIDIEESISQILIENKFVKLITQKNLGLSGARNTGLNNANGEYVFFLDSDDFIDSSFVLEILQYSIKYNLDICGFNHYKVNEHYEITSKSTIDKNIVNIIKPGSFYFGKFNYPISSWSYIYNREFLLKNNLYFFQGIYHEDVEHHYRLMSCAKKVMFVNLTLYYYLIRQGSITKSNDVNKIKKIFLDNIFIVNKIYQNSNTTIELKQKLLYINSITWNLLWRFTSRPNEVDYNFKMQCLNDLKEMNLYPIKGGLSTNFQRLATLLFNNSLIFKLFLKIRS